MSIVSRKEFAALCGDDVKFLNVYVARGKVDFVDEGKSQMDTTSPKNAVHLKKRQEYNKAQNEVKETIGRITPAPKWSNDEDNDDEPLPAALPAEYIEIARQEEKTGGRKKKNAGDGDDDGIGHYIKKKIIGDANLVEVRVELEKQKLSKMMGKLLPVDIVLNAHGLYAKNIFATFEKGCENIASMFCSIMAGGDILMYKQIVEDLRKELNRCVQDAGQKAQEDIEKMIDDYTETRSRGEKR